MYRGGCSGNPCVFISHLRFACQLCHEWFFGRGKTPTLEYVTEPLENFPAALPDASEGVDLKDHYLDPSQRSPLDMSGTENNTIFWSLSPSTILTVPCASCVRTMNRSKTWCQGTSCCVPSTKNSCRHVVRCWLVAWHPRRSSWTRSCRNVDSSSQLLWHSVTEWDRPTISGILHHNICLRA